MDLVDRLKEFIFNSGYTSTQFADKAQISRATLSQILSGRNKKISNELITKLHEAFPALDIMWLLFGEGQKPPVRSVFEPDENPMIEKNLHNDHKNAIVGALNQSEKETRPLENRPIQDNDIITFANNFFTHNSRSAINPPKADSENQDKVNLDNSNHSSKRRVTSIIIFYSDGTFEKIQTI